MKHPDQQCPTCRHKVPRDNDFFPFCSERCRLLDLQRWIGEEYRIAGGRTSQPEADTEE